MIDWGAAPPAWKTLMRSLAGAAADPPSVRARKAQRVRPLPPPTSIVMLRILWHEAVGRAAMLAALMAFRRSPYFSKVVSELLALAGSWFDGLPGREPVSLEEPALVPRP